MQVRAVERTAISHATPDIELAIVDNRARCWTNTNTNTTVVRATAICAILPKPTDTVCAVANFLVALCHANAGSYSERIELRDASCMQINTIAQIEEETPE